MTNIVSIPQVGESIPLGIAEWLACLAFLMWFVNLSKKFIQGMKDKPPPSEVQREAAQTYVSKAQCENLHNMLEGRMVFLDTQRVQDAKDFSASRGKLYDEIKGMQKAMSDDLTHVRVEMGDMERRLNATDEERTGHLHDRFNELLQAFGELRGEMRRGRKDTSV